MGKKLYFASLDKAMTPAANDRVLLLRGGVKVQESRKWVAGGCPELICIHSNIGDSNASHQRIRKDGISPAMFPFPTSCNIMFYAVKMSYFNIAPNGNVIASDNKYRFLLLTVHIFIIIWN